MLVLGVDTSLPLLSVALLRDGALIGAVTLEGKDSRNEKLLPAVDWLLSESGVVRGSIDLFAVTRGPGSFTGVRIGLATVQGLALALGKPVCAMSTHEAIASSVCVPASAGTARAEARGHTEALGHTVVADDAGRGEFYVSRFEGGVEVEAPHLAREIDASALRVADFLQRENVAACCARRAAAIAASGDLARYADITPIYVRLAEAEVKLQQRSGAQ
jgi:tRNA threonylcarbamoyladenosine biosynthesis protein TsaB